MRNERDLFVFPSANYPPDAEEHRACIMQLGIAQLTPREIRSNLNTFLTVGEQVWIEFEDRCERVR